ncbi:hypothetical protein [Gemmata sp.]|uniref:hypothetical protein n=1 Tax=Gemmata sp. TaxID=1914242 RepID=UPI003F6F29A2
MTEAEWLASNDPTWMLAFLQGKASDRKLRLFAVASGRLLAHGTTYEQADAAFRLSEGYADNLIDPGALRAGREQAIADARQVVAVLQGAKRDTIWAAAYSSEDAAEVAVNCTLGLVRVVLGPIPDWTLCRFVGDIFGNPFRPVAIDPQWLTSDVLALARGIYEEREFDRMPILADALQDAGCDSAAVLDHCRDPNGTHVRGCWVVDLLLGKS